MQIKDNTPALLRVIDTKIEVCLGQSGDVVVPDAKQRAPVRIGTLRDSIHAEVTHHKLTVGSTVPYGPKMEVHQPHLRPALHGKMPEVKRIFTE